MTAPDPAAMRPSVRRATPDDAQAIANVDVASWRAAYGGLMPHAYLEGLSTSEKASAWQASLGREDVRGKRTLVSEYEGHIDGYATVGRDPETGDGMLLLMYVAPERWGAGVGRSLMMASFEALRALGHRAAVLWVLEENTKAREFYEQVGWRTDGAGSLDAYGDIELAAVRYRIEL